MTDYKKYALGQLENFLYDAMSAEATPQEIYDVIKGVVQDNLNVYTKSADQARELLSLLNGHRSVDFVKEHADCYYDYDRNKPTSKTSDKDTASEECNKSWNDFWQYREEELDAMCAAAEVEQDMKNIDEFLKKDKVKSWVLPVEADGPSGEYFINFPDDLLEAANLKEGDQIEWHDQGDGSYLLKKFEKKANTYDEMIAAGYTMTDDGFWIKETK